MYETQNILFVFYRLVLVRTLQINSKKVWASKTETLEPLQYQYECVAMVYEICL